jgi:hypothetical protein
METEMLKMTLVNALGPLALVAVLGTGMPAQATQPANLADAVNIARSLGSDFLSVYLAMSKTDRDLLLFSLADRWSMRTLNGGAAALTATEQRYYDFVQMYVELSSTERNQLLFKLADERSMATLSLPSLVASQVTK